MQPNDPGFNIIIIIIIGALVLAALGAHFRARRKGGAEPTPPATVATSSLHNMYNNMSRMLRGFGIAVIVFGFGVSVFAFVRLTEYRESLFFAARSMDAGPAALISAVITFYHVVVGVLLIGVSHVILLIENDRVNR